MLVDLVVPEVGESIHEVQVLAWKKQPGDLVEKDEELVEVETEKATVPVSAPAAGRLHEVLKKDGEFAEVGDSLARIEAAEDSALGQTNRPSDRAAAAIATQKREAVAAPPPLSPRKADKQKNAPPARPSAPALPPDDAATPANDGINSTSETTAHEAATAQPPEAPAPKTGKTAAKPSAPKKPPAPKNAAGRPAAPATDGDLTAHANGRENRVPMSMLRQTIARRLVEAQQNAALVTTFNEVDMHEVIQLRRDLGETFQEAFDVKLGFMSFFVKAAVEGLKRCPEINARIDGREIVYQNFFDIGVAIGSGRGLVVPVLRNCERLSFAEIERQIAEFAAKVGEGRLAPQELEGGTFTISNGGVYGSLLSTPIVNPPQSGVLGLHTIQERPVAREGQVVIRPMMYIALTYDHRLVDGREAVGFLRRIKEVIETPARLFLEV